MSLKDHASSSRVLFQQYSSADALAQAAANYWLDLLAVSSDNRECWCVALSGGRTAAALFACAAGHSKERCIPWNKVEFFFADERWLPLDDEESNFRIANERLFKPLRISSKSVHPLYFGHSPAFDAAQGQADMLRRVPVNPDGNPILDLVILGMGEDGHVASLFPNAPAEVVQSRAVYLPVVAPKPPPQRITLTYAALAAARDVMVVVSGPGKEAALVESLSASVRTPLGHLIALRSQTAVFAA